MKKISIKINNKKYICEEGDTIGKVAHCNSIDIPGLCFHPDFPAKGNCRVCVVEIKGFRNLQTACSTLAQEGMEIFTESEKVKKERNMNIELIFAEHIEKCPECVWRFECPLLAYAKKYGIKITKFKDRKNNRPIHRFQNAVEIDGTQCIDCRNCVSACQMQKINFLEVEGKNIKQEIVPSKRKEARCILCGQCALHCPVSSAQEQSHWQIVENELKKKDKVIVAQFAPAIRVSIGEPFGLPHGKVVTENLVQSLRELGFNYVFDVNFGADVTTIIEARELISRLHKKEGLPMFTSCCPGWINYIELFQPQMIPYITTSRSPQIHNGGIIKTYWANKMKINPKNIIVVSVMPCTAKKYEITRDELKVNGLRPVDYVLTTRELAFLLKKNNINLAKTKKSKADNPLGEHSGGAAIFGGTGGVMESALRVAQFYACQGSKSKMCDRKIEFNEVRGMKGVKEAVIKVSDKYLRVAIVNGIGNVGPILENFKNYDYIEVMTCPGGCIGGGGQPIPTTPMIREKRVNALYGIDKESKMRKSHENKSALEVIEWLEKHPKLGHRVFHTHYKNRTKNYF